MINIDQIANFIDISNIINPEYYKYGYITKNMIFTNYKQRVKNYIFENNLKFGDIIFIGSEKQNKQEQGFQIVLENGFSSYSEEPYYLPLEIKNVKFKLKNKRIKYKNMFDKINKNNFIKSLFYSDKNRYDIINEYINADLWD